MIERPLLAFCLLVAAGGAAAQAASPIAGLHPDRRPDGAPPQPTQVTLSQEQLEQALHGIDGPAPGNVELIAATGKWWVPLRRPGMNAPYDLRGWHDAPPAADAAAASASAAASSPSR